MSGILGVLGSRMVRGSARECLACEILRLPGGRRLALPVDHGLCLQAIAGGAHMAGEYSHLHGLMAGSGEI